MLAAKQSPAAKLGVRDLAGLVVFFAIVFAAAVFAGQFRPGEWYASLNKPWWNPPNGVFAPVWTLLYVSIAVAGWMAWRRSGWWHVAIAVFVLQVVLNAAWSYIFFALQRPDLALKEIVVLWLVLVVNVALFWRLRPAAGALLVPYWLWVSFAAGLNYAIWAANRT